RAARAIRFRFEQRRRQVGRPEGRPLRLRATEASRVGRRWDDLTVVPYDYERIRLQRGADAGRLAPVHHLARDPDDVIAQRIVIDRPVAGRVEVELALAFAQADSDGQHVGLTVVELVDVEGPLTPAFLEGQAIDCGYEIVVGGHDGVASGADAAKRGERTVHD